MPATQSDLIALIPTTAPAATKDSDQQHGFDYDHLCYLIAFTLGSLTSLEVKIQFTDDGSTWNDVYDANATQIAQTYTADANYWVFLSSPTNQTRMAPSFFAAAGWRLTVTPTGTATGSSIKVDGSPFVAGMVPT